MPPLANTAVAWNWYSSSGSSPVSTTASESFHHSRPFCQFRLRFWRVIFLNTGQVRLTSPELREPWIRPNEPQMGWLQPRMKLDPAPRRMACMPRR